MKPVIGSNYHTKPTARRDPTGRHYKIEDEKPHTWKDYAGFAFFWLLCGLLVYFVYNTTAEDILQMKAGHQEMRRQK